MNISDKLPPEISRTYHLQIAQVERRPARSVHGPEASTRDEVSLSADARVVQKAKAAATAAPAVRPEKVAALKQKIAEGTYEIPLDALVDRLLGSESVTEKAG
ncbi:MAG: flagellar biosynthesis anti-sigma factor FlgM [Anaerolineae bacterium]|nr:flagellar biosynthesis anti-sigma factor FlgM [Anaerolineae bacterium]